ncbi:MAG: hypothetical protein PHW10_01270 [Candidatus Peribacteraceae bacterium]|nr:hypothetical protein [Candidatus Peribacteraceae bacterium]
MQKTCLRCQAPFAIAPDEETFVQKMTFTFGEQAIHPPLPVFCPECRLRIRTCHRNERSFYKRSSTLSGKDMVSTFHEIPLWGKPDKVYTSDEFYDDKLDNTELGRPYDFGKPFFPQFAALHKDAPRLGMMILQNENSDFSAGTAYCKNCYLINSSEYCEDCYYGKLYQSCKSSVDCSYLYNSELCYECFSVYDSYNCNHVSFSKNCRDCSWSLNLVGCSNCFLCSNLRQKEYHFENKPLPREEYERKVREVRGFHARSEELKRKLAALRQTTIHRGSNIVNSEVCSGDYIENSQRCLDCYDVNDSQDSRYVTVGVGVKDNYDCSNMYVKPELAYETLGTIETYSTAYCLYVFHSQNLLYCEYCFNCHDCFGCVALRHKQYCILNKQYSKSEYESLVPKIIEKMKRTEEWGKFFPPALSAFGYNESLAGEYLPLTKEEALTRGFYWRDSEEKQLQVAKTIPASRLPDFIDDIPDDITNWAIECDITKRPFKVTKQELDFYRKQRLPVPRLHPDVRYDLRLALRNPRQLWLRPCMNCSKEMRTTYAPDRSEIVYCEECYLASVY